MVVQHTMLCRWLSFLTNKIMKYLSYSQFYFNSSTFIMIKDGTLLRTSWRQCCRTHRYRSFDYCANNDGNNDCGCNVRQLWSEEGERMLVIGSLRRDILSICMQYAHVQHCTRDWWPCYHGRAILPTVVCVNYTEFNYAPIRILIQCWYIYIYEVELVRQLTTTTVATNNLNAYQPGW